MHNSIDTTETPTEKVNDLFIDETMEQWKITHPEKKFVPHPLYSGKSKTHSYKYEIVGSLFIGFVLSLSGPYDGPTGDQPIVRNSKRNKSTKDLCIVFKKKCVIFGDGHYSGFSNIMCRNDFPEVGNRIEYHRRRAKIENINALIRNMNVLCSKFRDSRGNSTTKKK